jgi:hypothetical protein
MKKGIYLENVELPDWELFNQIRDQLTEARGGLSDIRFTYRQHSEQYVEPLQGALTILISNLYHVVNECRAASRKKRNALEWSVRGVGNDNCPGCFVCGGEKSLYNNISAYVSSKELGEKIVQFFEKGAWLDYRKYEPNYLQVKVGACAKHLFNLQYLEKITKDGGISKEDVQRAQTFRG